MLFFDNKKTTSTYQDCEKTYPNGKKERKNENEGEQKIQYWSFSTSMDQKVNHDKRTWLLSPAAVPQKVRLRKIS